MKEYFFQCPYCWEQISMLLDFSISQQKYIEDCEVCCNPIQVNMGIKAQEITYFEVLSIEQ